MQIGVYRRKMNCGLTAAQCCALQETDCHTSVATCSQWHTKVKKSADLYAVIKLFHCHCEEAPTGPTWQSPGTMTQFTVQICQRYVPQHTFACNIFGNEDFTGSGAPRSESIISMIAGGNHTLVSCHVASLLAMTWWVLPGCADFEQLDKPKLEIPHQGQKLYGWNLEINR